MELSANRDLKLVDYKKQQRPMLKFYLCNISQTAKIFEKDENFNLNDLKIAVKIGK